VGEAEVLVPSSFESRARRILEQIQTGSDDPVDDR
jgi:hypothetical protein